MKTKLILLFVALSAAVTITQAQSKKDLEANYAKCTVEKDSLQKLYTGLTATQESLKKTCDSINKVNLAYDSMYRVIRDRVILKEFNPLNSSKLLDSLSKTRSLALSGISDSVSILKKENTKLQVTIDSLAAAAGLKDNSAVINQLKQLKELLDAQIITQAEFDTKKAKLLEKME